MCTCNICSPSCLCHSQCLNSWTLSLLSQTWKLSCVWARVSHTNIQTHTLTLRERERDWLEGGLQTGNPKRSSYKQPCVFSWSGLRLLCPHSKNRAAAYTSIKPVCLSSFLMLPSHGTEREGFMCELLKFSLQNKCVCCNVGQLIWDGCRSCLINDKCSINHKTKAIKSKNQQ